MPEQPRNLKRNNFTLSKEAQEIINGKKNKSRYVSQAIVEKSKK